MKTIGVLGGLGPQATIDFEDRVHKASQRMIPPHLNSGYPPMVVWYCRHAPFLLADDRTPLIPHQADPRLLEAAKRLGSMADFLVIPSNGAHLVQDAVEKAAGRKLLSIIDVTIAEVRRRGWKNVGLLALGEPVVYSKPLNELGIATSALPAERRDALSTAIFRVMEGRVDAESVAAGNEAIAALRAKKVDGIVLGCTELPLLLGKSAEANDLINPAELLAEAAVREALGQAEQR